MRELAGVAPLASAHRSGGKGPDRDHRDTVVSDVAISSPCDHTEHRGLTASLDVDDVTELQQRLRPLVDRRWPELDLERGPSPIGELDDCVDFESLVVSVVQHRSAQRLAEHTQVTDDERLEEEPEEVEVLEEPLGSDAQRGDGKRRINEVTLRR